MCDCSPQCLHVFVHFLDFNFRNTFSSLTCPRRKLKLKLNVKRVTLFGFSAGAQTILRYSLFPRVRVDVNVNLNTAQPLMQPQPPASTPSSLSSSSAPHIRFVVSDPSSFPYLDRRRPYTNGTAGFGEPDASWLPHKWRVSALDGSNWTTDWSACAGYNKWRYGLENLEVGLWVSWSLSLVISRY